MTLQVNFKDWVCTIHFAYYSNNRTAIQLRDAVDGSPIAKATVNIPDEPMENDEVAIKDYAENTGMYNTLAMAGIISNAIRLVPVGYEYAPICKLLVENPHGK